MCCGGPRLAADKRSGVDPFVIALAMVNQDTVVTEENATGNIAKPRIPDVCDALGVCFGHLTPLRRVEGGQVAEQCRGSLLAVGHDP